MAVNLTTARGLRFVVLQPAKGDIKSYGQHAFFFFFVFSFFFFFFFFQSVNSVSVPSARLCNRECGAERVYGASQFIASQFVQ
ncbi:MAG TPA: hypothetical protein VGQ62_11520 [Chloroflexota bacterium]|jgi:hypothetical protein|nr:hypothetical protein [Chloroflexota bacterium]